MIKVSQTNKEVQSQLTRLSPETMQSCRILAMGQAELEDYLHEQALENPLISLETAERTPSPVKVEDSPAVFFGRKCSKRGDDDHDTMPNDLLGTGEDYFDNLAGHLRLQLPTKGISALDRKVLLYLIESLDDSGFLTERADSLSDRFGISAERAGELLSILRSLDPPGVGAADVRECLLMQILSLYPGETLAREIVEHHLDEMAKNQLKLISKQLRQPMTEVKRACEIIKKLSPRPYIGGTKDCVCYIYPDMAVEETENGFELRRNLRADTLLKVDAEYGGMLESEQDEELRDYFSEKVKQLNWIKSCIESRSKTLNAVTQAIFEEQKMFFYKGPRYLKPLTLKTVAEKLDIHESTVSRAVRDKYIQCKWGLFEMKYFFSNKLHGSSGENTESNTLKILEAIVAGEPGNEPYSDQRLVEELAARGISLSRRTVTKYRLLAGIRNSRERQTYD